MEYIIVAVILSLVPIFIAAFIFKSVFKIESIINNQETIMQLLNQILVALHRR